MKENEKTKFCYQKKFEWKKFLFCINSWAQKGKVKYNNNIINKDKAVNNMSESRKSKEEKVKWAKWNEEKKREENWGYLVWNITFGRGLTGSEILSDVEKGGKRGKNSDEHYFPFLSMWQENEDEMMRRQKGGKWWRTIEFILNQKLISME